MANRIISENIQLTSLTFIGSESGDRIAFIIKLTRQGDHRNY